MLTRHCAVAICVAADTPILLAYQWPGHLFFDRRGPTSAANGVESPRWLYRDGHLTFGRVTKNHAKEVTQYFWLGVSTHLKNMSQTGNLPQMGVKIKKYLKPPPRILRINMGFKKIRSTWQFLLPLLGMVEVKFFPHR